MISRLGIKGIELVKSTIKIKPLNAKEIMSKSSIGMTDTIKLTSERIKNLNLYNSSGVRNNSFYFTDKGDIILSPRIYGSDDLHFLSHIKTKEYIRPTTYPHGTLPCSTKGIEQSNKLAKSIINENEHFIDGYRYCGAEAKFNQLGQNISRFSNGGQEIVIIDKTIDKTLQQTIDTFKSRLQGKKYTDEQKIKELMNFVDEVFSVNKSGRKTEEFVSNMQSSEQLEVLFGEIINSGAGVCRHRSLLTKLLGDEIGLKTRMIQGYYGTGGHAWNEIISGKNTYLFDSMHGNIFNVSNTSRNLVPQTFHYRITNPQDKDTMIQKYLNPNSVIGNLYRGMKFKTPIKTTEAILTPNSNGYIIEPLSNNISVNGKKISNITEVSIGDFVNIKDIGFQII